MQEISFCAIRELSLYSFVIKPSTSINSHTQEHRLFSFEFVVCGKFFGTTVNAPVVRNFFIFQDNCPLTVIADADLHHIMKMQVINLLTTSTGKPVGFLLPSLACNRTSFSDFGIQV